MKKIKVKVGRKVKFISYDGKFPNYCSGKLVLLIGNKKVTFPKGCLISGGSVTLNDDWSESVTSGPWTIKDSAIPDQYKDLKAEIEKVVNSNIIWGCCGGCA